MAERATCGWCCKEDIAVRKDGTLWRHWDAQRNETCEQRVWEDAPAQATEAAWPSSVPEGDCTHPQGLTWVDDGNGHPGSLCPGCGATWRTVASFTEPEPVERKVYASFHTECDECDGAIFEGDEIVKRAGSWVCARHADEEPESARMPAVDLHESPAYMGQDAADPFTVPAAAPEPERKKTDRNGYRVKDPRTGDFRRWKKGTIRSFTRATTFIKVASDRTQLQAWNERNVLIGAARHPDVAARALTWNADTPEGKRELDQLVDELSEKAGSKDAANKGTDIHASIEKWIAGAPLLFLPEDHRPYVRAFSAQLEAHKLRIVTNMVERTVFYPLPDDAGVVGTFDYIVQHVPTGRYYIGDLKTGAKMDYAWQEYEAQVAIYRDGYDSFGTYFWGDTEEQDRWETPELQLDELEALVFHVPAKHEGQEPYCNVLRANLCEGRDHLLMCYKVRTQIAKRPKPTRWETPQFHAEPEPPASERWRKGTDGLWSRADEPEPKCTWACDQDALDYAECPKHGDSRARGLEPEDRDWEEEFGQATSKLHLAGLYESARSVIDDEVRLRSLIEIGMARLAELEKEPPF